MCLGLTPCRRPPTPGGGVGAEGAGPYLCERPFCNTPLVTQAPLALWEVNHSWNGRGVWSCTPGETVLMQGAWRSPAERTTAPQDSRTQRLSSQRLACHTEPAMPQARGQWPSRAATKRLSPACSVALVTWGVPLQGAERPLCPTPAALPEARSIFKSSPSHQLQNIPCTPPYGEDILPDV